MTSTAYTSLSRSHLLTRLALILSGNASAVLGFARSLLNRRHVAELLELDDRELKDIGLVRNDVVGALAAPIHQDPSCILMVRSVERRARIRPVAVAPSEPATTKAVRPIVPFRQREMSETGWR